jgi:hypothetical protein
MGAPSCGYSLESLSLLVRDIVPIGELQLFPIYVCVLLRR